MLFTKQTQKLLFMFVVYSIIGFFIDSMAMNTWPAAQGGMINQYMPRMMYVSWAWGVAAIILYYVMKMKTMGYMAKIVMSSLVMILIGCAMSYGQSMLMDPVGSVSNCITGPKLVMWIMLVFAFSLVNKPMLRAVFGKSAK